MSYKTILVYLNDTRRAEATLEPAITLAARFGAHLIGVNIHPDVPAPPIALPFSAKVLGAVGAAERKQSEEIAATFARMTAGKTFTAEWRALKVSHLDLASVVMEHGRCADLIIAGQTNPDWDLSPLLDFPERLALESGRPVLVVPYAGRFAEIGKDVVIAWKPSRESARAVFDAVPLLKAASTVQILEIKEGRVVGNPDSSTAIAAALSRHGIKPTARSSAPGSIGIGDELLSRLADAGADMLVMGAYGHSRFRELVFGGATRHIAGHMTVPTLFSH